MLLIPDSVSSDPKLFIITGNIMAASFHFLFEIVKIALLSAGYSAVLFLFLDVIAKMPKLKFKKVSFFDIYRIVAIVLFVFMFTYYGDHGLGDESRIPIGNGKSVYASDGYPYLQMPAHSGQLNIGTFSISGDIICAKADSGILYYNLKSDKVVRFKREAAYIPFADKYKLPLPEEFENFYKHYSEYWDGWRFWLLP